MSDHHDSDPDASGRTISEVARDPLPPRPVGDSTGSGNVVDQIAAHAPAKLATLSGKVLAIGAAALVGVGGVVGISAGKTDFFGLGHELQEGSVEASSLEYPSDTRLARIAQDIDCAAPIFRENKTESIDDLNGRLDGMGYSGYNYFNREVVAASEQNTDQQVWDQIVYHYDRAWATAQMGNLGEARCLAGATAEGQEYAELLASFNNVNAPNIPLGVIPYNDQLPENAQSRTSNTGAVNGFAADGSQVRAFVKVTPYNLDKIVVVVRLGEGADQNGDGQGENREWMLVETLPYGTSITVN